MKKFFSGVWNAIKVGLHLVGQMFVLTTRYAVEAVRDHFGLALNFTYSVGRAIQRGWDSSKLLTILGMVLAIPGVAILWAIFPVAVTFYFVVAWIVAPIAILALILIVLSLAVIAAIPTLLMITGKWIMTIKTEKAQKINTSSKPQTSETSEAVEAEVVDTEE